MPNTTTETKRLTKNERAIAQHLAVAGRRIARGKLLEADEQILEADKLNEARRDFVRWCPDRPTRLVRAFKLLLARHPDYLAYRLSRIAYVEDLIAAESDPVPDALASALREAHDLGKRTRASLGALREREGVDGFDPRYLADALKKAYTLGFDE